MPTSTVAPAAEDRSASDSEEYEYEEVEVEEEIEVEEEVSDDDEEEEEEEEQKEEDVSRSIEDRNDVIIPPAVLVDSRSPIASDSEEYEYEETEIEEEMEVEEEVSDDDEEEVEEVEGDKKEEVEEQKEEQEGKGSGEDVLMSIGDRDDVKRKEKIISDDKKVSQCDGGIITAETTNPINDSSKPVAAETTNPINESSKPVAAETSNPINESSTPVTVGDSVDESDKLPRSEEQTTQMDRKDVNDAHLKEPSLDVDGTLKRPQSLSPAMEISDGTKRPALVCEFFAKGWCIKGTSCRFRHIKDTPVNVVDQQNESPKKKPKDKGVKESTGRSDDLATSATASTLIACSSELKPGSQKDNPKTVANTPVNKSPTSLFMGPNTHRSSWASFAPKVEDISGKAYHFGLHNHCYNSSYLGAGWPKTTTSLSSSSWKSNSKSSYNWELSKPFRSTYLISQGIFASDIQYDPIRDSIEQPTKNGDKLSKVSSSSRVPSISGTHSPLQEKLKTDFGSDRISVGSHVNGNDDDVDMDVDSNEIADTKQENTKSESKGKRQIGDVIQASEVNASGHYSARQNDDGATKEVNNYKLDFDAEGDMHRESKSVRQFRASLIEFVKELVRPSWRDGKLSKDAHKLIVKKAVDKVLTSLPPEHVPDIKESIDAYLTSSQPKLKKLVEGYIEKYGKL